MMLPQFTADCTEQMLLTEKWKPILCVITYQKQFQIPNLAKSAKALQMRETVIIVIS